VAAINKLGPRANEPGAVNPRVLKHIFDEGRFCEDPLMTEYLGGILASSKGEDSRDDRGSFYLNEIKSLSTYQIRTHYLIYSVIIRSKNPFNQDTSFWFRDDTITVAIPESGYVDAMNYSVDESHEDIAHHSFLGLQKHDLSMGGVEVCNPSKGSDFPVPFRYYNATRHGFELFLWGLGLGKTRVRSYFDLDPAIPLPSEPPFEPLRIELGQRHFH
jgi:hypothetical protein